MSSAPILTLADLKRPDFDWAEMDASLAFLALTPQQRVWVAHYLETGSIFEATEFAYPNATPKNANVMSYEIAKSPRVVAALAVASGKPVTVESEREQLAKTELKQRKKLIATVQKQLAAAEEGSVAATKLTTQLERLQLGITGIHLKDKSAKSPEVTEPSTQTFPIGAVITQDGKSYRVVAEEIS
jgi:hypothetical protein